MTGGGTDGSHLVLFCGKDGGVRGGAQRWPESGGETLLKRLSVPPEYTPRPVTGVPLVPLRPAARFIAVSRLFFGALIVS